MKGKNYITTTRNVPIDWTRGFNYRKLVEEEIEEYSDIQVTEDLREGGNHANKAWGYWFKYLRETVWKTSIEKEAAAFCNNINNPRLLSLGCGYGGIDLYVAKSLNKPYEVIAVDINEHLFAQAKEEAKDKDYHIEFLTLDLNFIDIMENSFDVIYAHASLHHLLNLEHLFHQVYKGLKNNGRFIIMDIIGKTQVLFWKENVDFAIDVVSKMPSKYRGGAPDPDAIIPPYVEPSIQVGMEGIRQEEIESQISRYFTPIKMFKYGSFTRMICTNPFMGKMFDPDIKEDREYLEYLFKLDLKQVEEGRLRPTEMFAVFEKKDIGSLSFSACLYRFLLRSKLAGTIAARLMRWTRKFKAIY